MKKLIFLISIILTTHNLFSQTLEQKLEGKSNFKEIMNIVETYYQHGNAAFLKKDHDADEEFENDYLFWKRWEYYYGSHLDALGNIVTNPSKKNWDGFNTYKANHSSITSPESSYSSWVPFGPTTVTRYGGGYNSGYGRVNCIAFSPTDANTLYVGTPQGGIWKTTNHGTSWTSLTDDIPSTGVSGLVVDRTNGNTIYALTGDGDVSAGGFITSYGFDQRSLGVLKTTDGGTTWQPTGDFPGVAGVFYGYKLIQHPINANTLFAATSNGIYKSTNGGTSWTQVQTGIFTDIEFKPGDATIMYAAQRGGAAPFWRSTNSGDTWSNAGVTGVPTTASRIAIGVSANNAAYVYLLTGPATGSGSFKGVYRSTNSGVNFSTQTTTPNILGYPNDGSDAKDQTQYDLGIEVDPNNASTVLTAGIVIWKSTNGGASFGASSVTQWYDDVLTVDYVHADVHNITYNPLNNRIYSCSDGGVGYSTDNGSNWTFISGSLQILATYHADWYEANQDLLASGNQDNGTNIKYSSTSTYRHIYGADGFDCVIKDDDPDTVVFVANGGILKTNDGGLTNASVSPAGVGTFPALARDFNSNRVIFAGDGANIFKSTNFGSSWSTSAAGVGSRALTTCPSNSDRLYCSDGTNTKRSDNATAAAASITYTTINGTPGYPAGATLTDIATTTSNSLDVYASFGGYTDGVKVYHSTDGGANWTNISGTLPNVPAQSVVVDKNATVYVGTDVGVFVRTTSMSDWQPFYNFLPKTPVSELIVNNTTNRIIACTFGRGNFYTDFYSTCPANLNIVGTLSGYKFYNASDFVISSATVNQGAGNNAALKAGNYVRLDPGFEVKNNSQFIAYIGACTTGGVPLIPESINADVPLENLYISAGENKRYPFASISSIDPQKNGARINVLSAGKYSLRITLINGHVLKVASHDKELQKGNTEIKWDKSDLPKGLYYAQLFKDNVMVHFHEFEIK